MRRVLPGVEASVRWAAGHSPATCYLRPRSLLCAAGNSACCAGTVQHSTAHPLHTPEELVALGPLSLCHCGLVCLRQLLVLPYQLLRALGAPQLHLLNKPLTLSLTLDLALLLGPGQAWHAAGLAAARAGAADLEGFTTQEGLLVFKGLVCQVLGARDGFGLCGQGKVVWGGLIGAGWGRFGMQAIGCSMLRPGHVRTAACLTCARNSGVHSGTSAGRNELIQKIFAHPASFVACCRSRHSCWGLVGVLDTAAHRRLQLGYALLAPAQEVRAHMHWGSQPCTAGDGAELSGMRCAGVPSSASAAAAGVSHLRAFSFCLHSSCRCSQPEAQQAGVRVKGHLSLQ